MLKKPPILTSLMGEIPIFLDLKSDAYCLIYEILILGHEQNPPMISKSLDGAGTARQHLHCNLLA